MSHTLYALTVIFALFILTIVTRAIPFVFSGILKNSAKLQIIGKYLPAYVMLLLTIYEVAEGDIHNTGYLISAFIAFLLLIIIHLWRRNMLLSIAVGIVSFMGFSYFFN